MSSLAQREEFSELLSEFCSGELNDDARRARFKELLRADADLRRTYIHYVQMHLNLKRALGGMPAGVRPVVVPLPIGEVVKPLPVVSMFEQRRPEWKRWLVLGGSLAAALVALAVLLRFAQPYDTRPIATLTQARECLWDVPLDEGAALKRERLVLTAGVAQLTFRDGAVMVVEAPAEIEPLDARSAYLHSGRVVVRADGSEKFTVDSPRARVLDLGTEFGVGVSRNGETLVQVFEGMVVADFNGENPKGKPGSGEKLKAGDAVALAAVDGASMKRIAFDQQRFIRRLPDPPPVNHPPDKWLVPYNTNQTTSMNAVRAPLLMTIDGDLSDWDRSQPFDSRCKEPYGENYNFTGHIMYDDQYVYVGGHVKDPAPMRNRIDPNSDPNVGWKGGSIQLRLCSDRLHGWPAQGELWRTRDKRLPRRVEDTNPRMAHMAFWFHQPSAQACLYIEYGMDFHTAHVNPAGYTGAFRKDEDGLGYTFEYQIPWSLLHADNDPPRAGDTVAACWNVHWSDAGGRLWKGMLVDLLNPEEKGTTYSRAATWGRLIFRP